MYSSRRKVFSELIYLTLLQRSIISLILSVVAVSRKDESFEKVLTEHRRLQNLLFSYSSRSVSLQFACFFQSFSFQNYGKSRGNSKRKYSIDLWFPMSFSYFQKKAETLGLNLWFPVRINAISEQTAQSAHTIVDCILRAKNWTRHNYALKYIVCIAQNFFV